METPLRPPPFDRAGALQRLAGEQFDVLVVGGGITGAGVALDAATRGLRTALVERGDFASGTSSKSSKLVHGGLRYLQQREVGLVYEGLAERQIALRNAPHLVRVLPFLIPVLTRDGVISRRLARALGGALWMYDLTGGLRIGKRHRRVTPDQAVGHMPSLRSELVAGGYLYYDAHTDDARLTLTLCRTAAAYGAAVSNYAGVTSLRKDGDGRVRGARVQVDGDEVEVRADVVVNAAGVWSDDVRALDEPAHPNSIRPGKGVHITVPWSKVRNDIAVVVPVAKDRRSVFVVPWGDLTYVGTTDTDYEGPLDDPECTPDDVAYLLRALNAVIAEPVDESDVLGTWAGLRPLLRSATNARTADLSRRHAVRRSSSGVVTVTGGKLTTYRRMAADTVDEVDRLLGKRRRCRTKRLKLLGADGYEPPVETNEPSRHEHLAVRYGTEAALVESLVDEDHELGEPLVPGLPYVKAEAVHAARREMARTLDDVLARRTRARLLARDDSAAAADDVATLVGRELGWDDAEQARQVKEYRAAVAAERDAADLPETALEEL
ncbi:MAG TPA: glycerol-3-phosphate dehydrogenase/oxidase [Acidimicrobiia bacterium]|nr:glycerol-3-phosphate dehydrogenase/oxidase [Acidimicrobiia bacterium]